MIVQSRVVARLEVADELVLYAGEGVLDAIGGRLEAAVIAEGENIGAWVHKGSVWVTKGGPGVNPFTTFFTGEWAPDPEQGCEFRGGPWDGEIRPLRREQDGKPVAQIVFPDPPQGPSIHEETAQVYPSPMPPTYRRKGIDSMEDRWIYSVD